MFYARFSIFWSLNDRSRSNSKRDIGRQSLKKLMIFGSESWNDSYMSTHLKLIYFLTKKPKLTEIYVIYRCQYCTPYFHEMHDFDTLITVPYGTVHSTEIDTHIPWIYGRTYLRIDPRGLPGIYRHGPGLRFFLKMILRKMMTP